MHPEAGYFMAGLIGLLCLAGGPSTVTGQNPTTFSEPGSALEAFQTQASGTFILNFDGTLKLPQTLVITGDTVIDGSGHQVALDGGQQVRHFTVSNGAKLRLVHLTLVNGYARSSSSNQPAGFLDAVCGGSILNQGGTLEVIDCLFTANTAAGIPGGAAPATDAEGLEPAPRGTAGCGGAICSLGGSLSATNCVFESNTVTGGAGGISAGGYTGGGGDASGGAVFSTDNADSYDGVSFRNNQAQAGDISSGRALEGGGSAYGGGLADNSSLSSLVNCLFTGNRAVGATRVNSDTSRPTGIAEGGALYHGSGRLTISGTMLQDNSSTGGLGSERGGSELVFGDGHGGGIFNAGALQIVDSTFWSNLAKGGDVPGDCCAPFLAQAGTGQGGGLANAGRTALSNCTVVSNSAAGGQAFLAGSFTGAAYGGALAVLTGSVTVVNVTLAANQLEVLNVHKAFGSTIANLGGTLALTNTLLSCDPALTNVWGTFVDGGHNLSSDTGTPFSEPTSRNGLDPLLGPLQPNSGWTWSMLPLPASPAIDAGDDAVCPPADQRGALRPQGLASDIGAVEVIPQLTLAGSAEGPLQLAYVFRAGLTNQVSVSTNLLDWVPLGLAVSDGTGKALLGVNAHDGAPVRFYKVQPMRP